MRLERASAVRGYHTPSFQFHKGAIRTINRLQIIFSVRVFQFHKGAIRTLISDHLRPPFAYFNSIKVRLELYLSWLLLKLIYFNSIKVRLERKAKIIMMTGTPTFQFHKGAIRTLKPADADADGTQFQFHKGAIRTFIHQSSNCLFV